MAPSWHPLDAKHQQYLDQILAHWERKSEQIERYRCKVQRWEYTPVWGPKDTYRTYSEGVVKYAAPDKGLFRIDKLWQYKAPGDREGKGTHEQISVEDNPEASWDYWICDGHWAYQFDHAQKKLIQYELPPDARGQAIGEGPLPFLFNAKAQDIKRRFWLRVITPKEAAQKNEYHLEAVPRTQEDAASFKKLHLIIDGSDFLPKAMVVFERNNKGRTTYAFSNREVNFNILAQQLNLFHREFFKPATPAGWEREVRKWDESTVPPATAGTASAPSRVQR